MAAAVGMLEGAAPGSEDSAKRPHKEDASESPGSKRPRSAAEDELAALIDAQNWTGLQARCESLLQQDAEQADFHHKLGVAKAHLRDVAGASACFEAALKLNPASEKTARNLKAIGIEMLLETKDFIAAKDRCKELIALEPDQLAWHMQLAKTLHRIGDDVPLLEQLQAMTLRFPEKEGFETDALRLELHLLAKDGEYSKMKTRVEEELLKKPEAAWLHDKLAEACFGCRDETGSIQALQQAVRLDPRGVDEHGVQYGYSLLLAQLDLLRDEDRWEEVKAKCQDYLASNGEDAELHYKVGIAHEMLDAPREALASFIEAARLEPDNEVYALSISSVKPKGEKSAQHFAKMKATFEEFIRNNPNSTLAHSQLGQVKRNLGDLEGAIESFNMAGELDPANDHHAHCASKAKLDQLRRAGDWPAFEGLARELIGKHPRHAASYHAALSRAQRKRGDHDGAMLSLKEAALLNPECFADALLSEEIEILMNSENWAKLEEHVQSLLQTRPKAAWLQVELGFAQLMLSKPSAALESFSRALALEPECDQFEFRFLEFAENDDVENDQARDLCGKLIEAHPNNAFLYSMLGDLQQMREDLGGALSAFQEAAKLAPGNKAYGSQAQRAELLLLRSKGEWERLKERCTGWLSSSPEDPWLHHVFGRTVERLGDFVQARSSYREALRLAPAKEKYAADEARAAQFVQLPEISFQPESFHNEQACCHICLEDYVPGDVLRQLPCGHHLHSECAGPALAVRTRQGCPVCRQRVFQGEVAESSSDWDTSSSEEGDESGSFSSDMEVDDGSAEVLPTSHQPRPLVTAPELPMPSSNGNPGLDSEEDHLCMRPRVNPRQRHVVSDSDEDCAGSHGVRSAEDKSS